MSPDSCIDMGPLVSSFLCDGFEGVVGEAAIAIRAMNENRKPRTNQLKLPRPFWLANQPLNPPKMNPLIANTTIQKSDSVVIWSFLVASIRWRACVC